MLNATWRCVVIDKNYAGKGRVALLHTQPETVLDDYLQSYREHRPQFWPQAA